MDILKEAEVSYGASVMKSTSILISQRSIYAWHTLHTAEFRTLKEIDKTPRMRGDISSKKSALFKLIR